MHLNGLEFQRLYKQSWSKFYLKPFPQKKNLWKGPGKREDYRKVWWIKWHILGEFEQLHSHEVYTNIKLCFMQSTIELWNSLSQDADIKRINGLKIKLDVFIEDKSTWAVKERFLEVVTSPFYKEQFSFRYNVMGLMFAFFSHCVPWRADSDCAFVILLVAPAWSTVWPLPPLHWWFLRETTPVIIRFMFDIGKLTVFKTLLVLTARPEVY